MLLDLVAFSLWPYLLLRNVLLLWLMSTQCLCVQQYPPKSRTCLPFPHLEFSWLCLSTGNPDPLLYPVVYCWSCQFKAAKALVRSEMILHCNIIFYLSAAAGVARLMRSSCVPSISFMLFALWYPSAQVDDLRFFLYFCCAAWKCACKFAQVFPSRCLSSHLSQSSYNRPVLYMRVYITSKISLSAIVRPPSFANYWIS